MKKKLTALVLSLVIAAMPAAAPVMNVQTVSAATTKAAVLKNTWSKDHKYYYDKNGKKVKGIRKIGKYTYIFDSKYTLVKTRNITNTTQVLTTGSILGDVQPNCLR